MAVAHARGARILSVCSGAFVLGAAFGPLFAWIEEHLADDLSDLTVDAIAARVGFGAAAALRQHFARARGVSPQQCRRQFAC